MTYIKGLYSVTFNNIPPEKVDNDNEVSIQEPNGHWNFMNNDVVRIDVYQNPDNNIPCPTGKIKGLVSEGIIDWWIVEFDPKTKPLEMKFDSYSIPHFILKPFWGNYEFPYKKHDI